MGNGVFFDYVQIQLHKRKTILKSICGKAFVVAMLIINCNTMVYAQSSIQVLPPVTEATKTLTPPTVCPSGTSSLLSWDGTHPISCASGVSATGGNVTTGTVTVTTTVSPGSTCATNGAIAQSNASPGVLLSCQSNIWSLAQGTTVGWVSMPPSSTTNSFYNRFTPQANISPTQWCITSGYSASAGVCKGISVAAGNTAVESSVLANYTQGFWTWGCNDIGSNYMDSNYQILCVK